MTGQRGLLNCGTLRALWVLEGRVGVTQLKQGGLSYLVAG